MFFSKVIRLVTIVLRNCGEMFFLELHHLVNIVRRNCGGRLVGTNGLLGCGLAFVRAMALKKLANSRLSQKGLWLLVNLRYLYI